MTDIRDRLRAADPFLTEPALPPEDVTTMRTAVVAAAGRSARPAVRWRRHLVIAAAAAVMLGAALDMSQPAPARPVETEPAPAAVTSASGVRTQLHFSTPGGTRIIWTLDPAFHLTEQR